MAFSIKFIPERVPESTLGNTGQYGEIELGEHRESFISLVGYWSPHDYQQHWRKSVQRLVETGDSSCLITSIHDPRFADVMMWWLLYPVGHGVAIQSAVLLLRELEIPFDPDNPFRSIPPRGALSEEGAEISEWMLPLADFREFLART